MTALVWDDPVDRRYEAGADRAVLFLPDGRFAAWNGLTGVEESTGVEVSSYYLDGVKFLERHVLGDYAGTLKAFTYPEEFDEVVGTVAVSTGLTYHNQKPSSFGLAYRTKVGNWEGPDAGYRIHLLYNLRAVPGSVSFSTLGSSGDPIEFTWTLSSVPPVPAGYMPTTHISIDSTKTDPDRVAAIERLLYGDANNDPRMPSIEEFTSLFELYDALVITDNGDGTWTATDLTEAYISMIGTGMFQIANGNANFIDANTYTISTTNAP